VKQGAITVNPWKSCVGVGTPLEVCTDIHNILNISRITDPSFGERDGSLAGLMLGGLMALFGLLAVCCNKKCAVVGLSITSFIFCCAGVGCFVVFKLTMLDIDGVEFAWDYGFGIACSSVALALLASASACCMRRHNEYFQIA